MEHECALKHEKGTNGEQTEKNANGKPFAVCCIAKILNACSALMLIFFLLFARFFRFAFLFLGIMKKIYRNTDAKRNGIADWHWIGER